MRRPKLKIADKKNILSGYLKNSSDNLFGRFWNENKNKRYISTHINGRIKAFYYDEYSKLPKSIARLFAAKWAKGKDKDIELISLLMTYKPKQLVRIMNSLDKL